METLWLALESIHNKDSMIEIKQITRNVFSKIKNPITGRPTETIARQENHGKI